MVVYLDRVFLLNLLIDYLLLLSAAQLSGRTLSRLRLLLCAAGGGLYAVATFLPGCGFLRGPLCQLAAGGAMALCAFRGRRRPALLFLLLSGGLAGFVLALGLLNISFQVINPCQGEFGIELLMELREPFQLLHAILVLNRILGQTIKLFAQFLAQTI